MTIYSAVTGTSMDAIEREFEGKGYGYFKEQVGNAVAETLAPIQKEYDRLLADKAYLEACYQEGAAQANRLAMRTLRKVYKKVGFLPLEGK